MYHETTYREVKERRRRRIVAAVAALLLCAVLAVAGVAAERASREQSAVSVREAVVTAAMQCAAIEGSFPSSVAYLEEYYGLVISHDRYLVYYEWLGDNVLPDVRVVPR